VRKVVKKEVSMKFKYSDIFPKIFQIVVDISENRTKLVTIKARKRRVTGLYASRESPCKLKRDMRMIGEHGLGAAWPKRRL
jgi:hypothetical protein